jgi:2,4-dienoyl-CoA reductase-like NADH-dependent reductase (Old Yellow Enzyme family)
MMTKLLQKLDRPDFIKLRNRTVMSAMSRGFAGEGHLVTDAMRDYYRRRAEGGAGLILTEGTIIHPSGDGWNNAPFIATDAQAQSWKPTIDAVHQAGGAIACQLWHCGRISHSDYTGDAPVSSTNNAAAGINRQNGKPYGEPRALTIEEMPTIYGYYADATRRALDVGFDAVEAHVGHGYLADQFLDSRVNDRTDAYGGSVENRCRFALELMAEILKVAPAERVIARISPSRFMGGIYDWPELEEMLAYFIPALQKLGLVALDVSCANSNYFDTSGRIVRMIRPMWKGVIMGGASLTAEQAEAELDAGLLDMVTWGRAFIANPDLVSRIKRNDAWTPFDDGMRDTLV